MVGLDARVELIAAPIVVAISASSRDWVVDYESVFDEKLAQFSRADDSPLQSAADTVMHGAAVQVQCMFRGQKSRQRAKEMRQAQRCEVDDSGPSPSCVVTCDC